MNLHDYFTHRFSTVSNEVDDMTYPNSSRFSPFDTEAVNHMFPLGDDGNIVDLLTRLMQSNSALERNQILQLLNDNGQDSVFAKLDDETKLSLLKPRSLQSLGELQAYGDVVKSAIKQLSSDDSTSNVPNGNEPNVNEPNGNEPNGNEPNGTVS